REAGRVSFFDWRVRILGEADRNSVLCASSINMGFAWAMAALAAKLFLRGLGMQHHGIAHDGVFETLLLVGMARDANLAADIVGGTRASIAAGLLGCIACRASMRTEQDDKCKAQRYKRTSWAWAH